MFHCLWRNVCWKCKTTIKIKFCRKYGKINASEFPRLISLLIWIHRRNNHYRHTQSKCLHFHKIKQFQFKVYIIPLLETDSLVCCFKMWILKWKKNNTQYFTLEKSCKWCSTLRMLLFLSQVVLRILNPEELKKVQTLHDTRISSSSVAKGILLQQ